MIPYRAPVNGRALSTTSWRTVSRSRLESLRQGARAGVCTTCRPSQPASEAIVGDVDLPHKILHVRKRFAREEVQQIDAG